MFFAAGKPLPFIEQLLSFFLWIRIRHIFLLLKLAPPPCWVFSPTSPLNLLKTFRYKAYAYDFYDFHLNFLVKASGRAMRRNSFTAPGIQAQSLKHIDHPAGAERLVYLQGKRIKKTTSSFCLGQIGFDLFRIFAGTYRLDKTVPGAGSVNDLHTD